jgi:DNA-binding SARP family transcriptional activator/tetratricopeptide (TPR) repeat protein
MRFRILGPVEAQADGGEPVVLPPKPRALLAVLLVNAGRPVSRDRLMAALWPDGAPPSAPRVIRTYVSALRRSLRLPQHAGLPRLVPVGDAYRLEVAPDEVDMLVFDDLAERGRRALDDGDATTAARLLDQALVLWRGPPASDVTVDGDTGAVLAGLAERRLLAEEDRANAELILGRDAALIARLRMLVAAHPLRERPWGQLMTALYRTGQRAAALACYRQLREHLIAELGVEPGLELAELHQQILAGDSLPARQPAAIVPEAQLMPRQLPPDVSYFTGRDAELGQLDELLGTSGAGMPATVVITAINGTPGVGKTALAVHWAHRMASRFPDGQLYASLRGHAAAGAAPADPLAVLARFLRELGIAAQRIPGDLDEAAAMYRSLLEGKRILIVLDNAASSGQVRPLLPGARDSAVIVTSRSRLPGLGARDGAAQITLAPFLPDEAATLLRQILGARRADAEPPAVAAIAAECAFLPLALRIAAERAISRPRQTLAALAAQLTAARDRLDVLTADDDPATSVRTVFSWSYQALPAGTARMFRLLGVHPGQDIAIPAAAALAATGTAEARQLLEALAAAHLLEEASASRYRFHDLLRAYAAERAAIDDSPADRAAALLRVLTWYLHTADAAGQLLDPGRRHVPFDPPPPGCQPLPLAGYEQALAWCDAERASLLACVRSAAQMGHDHIAWQLPVALFNYFDLRKPKAESIACARIALRAARRCGDRFGEAWVLDYLGCAYSGLWFTDAVDCWQQSLLIRRDIGDRLGEAAALNNIGAAYLAMDRCHDGLSCFRQALAIAREIHNQHGEMIALINLGEAHLKLGRSGDAIPVLQQALDLARATDHSMFEGIALHTLGESYRATGEHDTSVDCFRRALSVRQRTGDRHGQAQTLRALGDLLHDLREADAANASWQQALDLFQELGDPQAGELGARLRTLSRVDIGPGWSGGNHLNRVIAAHPNRNQARGRDWTTGGSSSSSSPAARPLAAAPRTDGGSARNGRGTPSPTAAVSDPCRRPAGRDDQLGVSRPPGPGGRRRHGADGRAGRPGRPLRRAGRGRGARPRAHRGPSAAGRRAAGAIVVGPAESAR